MGKMSPMMEQYLNIKAAHKDHVLFFRLGDFYEMFFDDAIQISKELELTLTGRDCGLPERAPMCGIPFHASDAYIKRLIDKGYKVAICEQTEDPSVAKGIVKREVVRVITPGTIIEGDMLEESKNNYIAALFYQKDGFAACFADISTGEAYLIDRSSKNAAGALVTELSKFMPSELLCNQEMLQQAEIATFIEQKLDCVCSLYQEEHIELEQATETILLHFQVDHLEKLAIPESTRAMNVLGGLILYLNQTQHEGAKRITSINCYQDDQYMNLDITARRNLEITETMRSKEKKGTLLWVLDKTKTSMGKRFLRKSLDQPLLNVAEITRRQNAVGELFQNSIALSDIRQALGGVYDLERLMTRVLYGSASPRELRALETTSRNLPMIKELTQTAITDYLKDIHKNIDILEDVATLVDNAIVEEPPILLKDGGYIKAGFNSTLDELRSLCQNSKQIIEEIETTERKATGIKSLKIKYNRVFGYYIEITNSFLSQVPEHYIRKQTLTNAERYITQELKELESKVLSASEKILALESEIFHEVRNYIASQIDKIQTTATAIAKLDFIASLAQVALQNNYICPQIVLDGKIIVKDGRHPVVEEMMNGMPFVPNDVELDQKNNRMVIITGPNMAGKSTYMRQVAIISIMAQIGSFVPASSATISIVDQIFTRVGASDDLAAGQSTFMVEMSEVAHILKYATPRSLVILDEIGRGTSTFDGMSIARSVVEYICSQNKLKCKTLFATHYHELTALENELDGVKNYNIAVKKRGDDITFLRKIVRGGADDSFGIEVAKLAGVPEKVVSRAKEILKQLEDEHTVTIVKEVTVSEEAQASFHQYLSKTEETIRNTSIDTLSPIEALNLLYELKKML